MENASAAGAQTERRGEAGPGRVLLGGETSPAALIYRLLCRRFLPPAAADYFGGGPAAGLRFLIANSCVRHLLASSFLPQLS